jgi:hypothetical protein
MRYQLKTWLVIAITFCGCSTQAAIFGEKEPVQAIKPEAALSLDGALTLDFAWRSDLGFDAKKIDFQAEYNASKPDAKGVKSLTRKDCGSGSNGEIALPFPRNCQKWQEPIIYTLILKPEWIKQSAANKLSIQLPERIKGAGDYQLAKLRFNCPSNLCKDKRLAESGLLDRDFEVTFIVEATDHKQHTLVKGVNTASSFTAQYSGVLLGLEQSQGFYGEENHADLSNYNGTENGGFYSALQDEDGKWHVSEMAFRTRHEGSCTNYNGTNVNAKSYANMKWAQAFPAATYGSVYDAIIYDKNYNQVHITPTQWTGCVSFKAENPQNEADGEEERQYSFENGKLYKRRIQRSIKNVSLDETIYLDSQGKLSTYHRLEYNHIIKKETKLVWSQLEQDAYPETKPAPNVDLKTLQLEAADVLKIIAPEFVKKP